MLTLTICGLQFVIEQLEFRNAAVKVRIMVLVVPNQSSNASGVDSQMLDRNVMMGQPCPKCSSQAFVSCASIRRSIPAL